MVTLNRYREQHRTLLHFFFSESGGFGAVALAALSAFFFFRSFSSVVKSVERTTVQPISDKATKATIGHTVING